MESKDKGKKLISQEEIMKALDTLYQKSIDGIQKISPPIDQFANDYLKKQSNPQKAAKSMIKNQIAKCTTSGFITGFGGVITFPVTIPANVGSVLYVQMRMIACTAYMAGLDINRAYKMFFEGDFSTSEDEKLKVETENIFNAEVIDCEAVEVED